MNDVLREGLSTQGTAAKVERLPARLVKVNTYAVRSTISRQCVNTVAGPRGGKLKARKKPKAESA